MNGQQDNMNVNTGEPQIGNLPVEGGPAVMLVDNENGNQNLPQYAAGQQGMVPPQAMMVNAGDGNQVTMGAWIQQQVQAQVQAQLQQLAQGQNQVPAPVAQPVLQAHMVPTPRHKLPHLAKFSGKREDWSAWKLQAQMKINTDRAAIGTAQDQIGYLFSSLEIEPQQRLALWVSQAMADVNATPEQFMENASSTFGDPNEERNALNKLVSMRQGKQEPLHQFLPRFQAVLARAGGLRWTPTVQINYLEQSLNDEMAQQLVTIDNQNQTFADYTSVLLTIDTRLQQLRSRTRSGNRFTQTQAQHRGPRPVSTASDNGPAPMDCGPLRAKWVSKDVLKNRRENSLCLRCGGADHLIKGCPFRPAQPPAQVMSAKQVDHAEEATDESSKD